MSNHKKFDVTGPELPLFNERNRSVCKSMGFICSYASVPVEGLALFIEKFLKLFLAIV